MQTLEEQIWEVMISNHGALREECCECDKKRKVLGCKKALTKELNKFKKNPSATNYQMMAITMNQYQYWFQKHSFVCECE